MQRETQSSMEPSSYPPHFPSSNAPSVQKPFRAVPQPNLVHEVDGDNDASAMRFFASAVLRNHLQLFWQHQRHLAEHAADYRQHDLPLARIKRIMELDGHAQMVSADTPAIFAKACEMFVQELTLRSWLHAEESMRSIIRESDATYAISQPEVPFNFLAKSVIPDQN